ncbi:MAG: 3-oxoacyl-ACP reductase FabG [Bacteroidales bacterium]|nr:3-oxoacyl-ACP reductase FabG [Bacteroidales bacterium]MBQ2482245.1 3-oxoacyl-ACP reductase FabG [Bacteroidales bacterium]MBR2135971.1 3-oxoacyl-ACP reductase FabG [Bacteroidales bacterium]
MKYALVTGGSRGIGAAICKELARNGYPVIINYVSREDAAMEVKREIEAEGGKAELLKFDVADHKAADQVIDGWISSHPDDYIAVLVNNAGIRRDGLMMWMEDSDWYDVINIHLNGFFHVTRKLITPMAKKKWGRVISVASLSGIKGMPGQTNYSAAKGGIIAATKALALEVAKRRVTVNAVAPGFVETDMTKELDQNTLRETIPAGRFGTAEEVADLVSFLASDKASYITGQVVEINGGLNT